MRGWKRTWCHLALLATLSASGCSALERSDVVEPEVLGASIERSATPVLDRLAELVAADPTDASTTTTVRPVVRAELPRSDVSTSAAPTTALPAAPPTTSLPSTAPAAAAAPAAPAATAPSGVADAAVAIVRSHFDWSASLPDWRVELVGPRAGYQGSTFPDERLVQVYVRPSMTTEQIAHVLAHELGHAVDVSGFDDATRAAVNVARGRAPEFRWFVGSGESDFASGAGDWAETFAWWATGGLGGWRSEIGRPPTAADLIWIEATVRAAVRS